MKHMGIGVLWSLSEKQIPIYKAICQGPHSPIDNDRRGLILGGSSQLLSGL